MTSIPQPDGQFATRLLGRHLWQWSTGAVFPAGAFLLFASAAQAQSTIVGRVTDARSAQPISSVTLQVEGTALGATSGVDGRYRIANVAADTVTVIARRIGYVAVRRRVPTMASQQTNVDFELEVSATMLDQVVVTGTAGGEARRSIGNAVTTIDAGDALAKSSATNLTTLLTARAPGLLVLPTTGRLGAGPDIRIRGRSSVNLSNSPLIYVDGVRINNASAIGPVAVPGGLGGQGSQVGGRLNDISADDIESIEVISGPAAATIYGTEASSGVIQIITKRGRAGDKPAMSFRMETGSLYFRDAENRVPTNYDRDKNGAIVTWNGVKQEADSGRPLFRTGLTRQYTGTAAGGRDQMRYYLSSGYENDYGIEPNNSMLQFSTRANLSTPLTSTTDLTTSFNYAVKSEHLGADVGESALLGAEFGHSLLFPNSRGFAGNIPPEVPQTLYDNADGINRLIGSMTLNNRPLTWFSQRAVVGVDYTTEDARAIERFAPPELVPFLTPATAGGRIGQTLRRTTMLTADYSGTAKVDLTPRISSISSVGGQFYNTEANSSFLGGSGFPAPGVETVSSASTAAAATQSQTINTTIGAYAQQQFGWQNRLFATAALRVDNNSAFGEDFKWVTYPKLSASWVVNEEPWWRWSSSVNMLRLRAAYGESGRAPAAYSALRTFMPIAGASAITPAAIGSPALKPERGKELEIGLEANVWNRLEFGLTFYSKRTIDAILTQTAAPSSGFASNRLMNVGRVDNHGVELQATFQAVKRRDVSWEIAGNVGTTADKIISQGDLPFVAPTSCGSASLVGYPIISIFCRRVLSADRDPVTGFATNVRCDGNDGNPAGVPCATAPFVFLGRTLPPVTGAITNTINIGKRLRFYALTDFNSGRREPNTVDLARCTGALGAGLCRANYYPQEYSPIHLAEATSAAAQGNYFDQYFMDGSYIKLREVSASFDIPERWLGGMQTTFTLAARELHTWTHFGGLDPDAQLGPSTQAVTPPLNRILATLNVRW